MQCINVLKCAFNTFLAHRIHIVAHCKYDTQIQYCRGHSGLVLRQEKLNVPRIEEISFECTE